MRAGFAAKFTAEEACCSSGWLANTHALACVNSSNIAEACQTGNLSLALGQVVVAVFMAMLQNCLKV